MRTHPIAACLLLLLPALSAADTPDNRTQLDAPLLIVKRHPYMADHIYDDYYTWHPGGGIYIIENPADLPEKHRVRAVIDPGTPETLGIGVYRDPELSHDAKKIVFAFKGSASGDTSIYEIGIDGKGLRRLTNPGIAITCATPVRALGAGRHDINPCYLPDGRIVFTSTRQGSRVPCFNSEVDILHVMNADGSDVRPISVNNVTDFDPVVMPDGRILYGRWEYVDKTALYMQSLWTIFPDGSNETAFFGNNMAKPTAFLDPRPVPGSDLVVCSLTPHNGQSVGAIAMIDPNLGKNGLHAITNFTPEYPTEMDQGLMRGPSDPWPLNRDAVLISNNAKGHGVIELITRSGQRTLIHADPDISCFSPMLVKPRPVPPVIAKAPQEGATGTFFVQDIYQGMTGVQRGEVKRVRVLEETTRISGIPGGGRWWNQAFLVSWQGAYTVKNCLGVAPVAEDGSVHFAAPAGRALYFQALDGEGRALQSMRTFVAAAPSTTRSCMGCHEEKLTAPTSGSQHSVAPRSPPTKLRDELWGSGYVDYPTMVQPILDRHCVRCHGGDKGINGGIDLAGGWTWAFSISYETLLKNTLTGFLNCENGSVKTSELHPPRTHGSGAAPLANLLIAGHEGRIPGLTRKERDLVLAWMDSNSNYYGTWNWSEHATCDAILEAGRALSASMRQAGCVKCHDTVGNDWINLQSPTHSRILRAPLAQAEQGFGLGWCRDRKAVARMALVNQSVQPPDVFQPARAAKPDPLGDAVVTFASTSDASYQSMLRIIEDARAQALASPRVDMPGAEIQAGVCRHLVPTPLPDAPLPLRAVADDDGVVNLSWPRTAGTIGLSFEVHRSASAHFTPNAQTRIASTVLFEYADLTASTGHQHYTLVPISAEQPGQPSFASIAVPTVPSVPPPVGFAITPRPGELALRWSPGDRPGLRYNVYRSQGASQTLEKLTATPIRATSFTDVALPEGVMYRYVVRTVDRRGNEGSPSVAVTGSALPDRREPAFIFNAREAKAVGPARATGGTVELSQGGHFTVPHRNEFNLAGRFSISLRVWLDEAGQMPVIASCGVFDQRGWFIQAFNGRWRWHVGGVSCDGGKVVTGRWVKLLATFDGQAARIYQDGVQVSSTPCQPERAAFPGALHIGQYSGGVGPAYQTTGKIADVRIYHCAFTAEQAAELHGIKGR